LIQNSVWSRLLKSYWSCFMVSRKIRHFSRERPVYPISVKNICARNVQKFL